MCIGLYWCIVYDLCFGNSVEGLISIHEVNDAFDEVSDLNPDVPEERVYGPYTNDHDSLWVYSGYEELHCEF